MKKHQPSLSKESSLVLSMDVFDSTITRACGHPRALFLWLGRKLSQAGLVSCSPEVFARARIRAEACVWQRIGGLDSGASLVDFYNELIRLLWLDPVKVPKLVEMELNLEESVFRPILAAKQTIQKAVEKGHRIVFTSDTYFSTEFVEKQLKGLDLWTSQSTIFCSSRYAKSKASGRLFDELADSLNIQPKAVTHAGDNYFSDVKVPMARGMNGLWLPEGRLNRYENLLFESMWSNSGLGAAFSGASRLARLCTSIKTDHERFVRDIAAGVAAPALVAYVLWVICQAKKIGLSRLYFLARDGQVLFAIAKRLLERLAWPIEARYLYVSRLSTNLAATFRGDLEEVRWILREIPYLPIKSILSRLDVSWNEVADKMNQLGIQSENSFLGKKTAEALEREILSDPIRRILLERAERRRHIVVEYLRQEEVLAQKAVGLVDFGGEGSQMRALHALVANSGSPSPYLFLVALSKQTKIGREATEEAAEWLAQTIVYLFDMRRNFGYRHKRGFSTMFQMFCAADHGTVTGYRESDGRITPVLSDINNNFVSSWGLAILRDTINSFVENLTLDTELVDLAADMRDPVINLIDLFWTDPSVEEARAWGAFPFENWQSGGGQTKQLAYPYTWLLIARQMVGGGFPNQEWNHWYEASSRMSPKPLRNILPFLEKLYRYLGLGNNLTFGKIRGLLRSIVRVNGTS